MNSMINKTVLTALFAFVLLASMASSKASAAVQFTDVPAGFTREIEYLVQEGIVKGKSNTHFGSTDLVERDQAATMIGRALGMSEISGQSQFPDVKSDYYATGYINAAVEAGIITGDSNGNFRPKDHITRGEVAFLLTRAFNFQEMSSVFYKDVPTTGAQAEAVNKITTAGITNGVASGTFGLKSEMNRVEFAVFLARSVNPEFRVTYENASIGSKYVTATELNVRQGPSANEAIVGVLKQNEKVQVFANIGNWSYISNGDITGYVHNGYLADSIIQPPTHKPGKRVIAIDAGHGGKDPGAAANGLREKDINLDVSLRIEKKLKARGIDVVMTRRTDVFHELGERVKIAERNGADSFVSIHTNSHTPGAHGTETYYYASSRSKSNDSKQLATFIQKRLVKAIGTRDRGVKTAGFQVIKYNPLPAALVELAFVTNKEDAQKLGSDHFKNLMAEAITDGIEDYYNWKETN